MISTLSKYKQARSEDDDQQEQSNDQNTKGSANYSALISIRTILVKFGVIPQVVRLYAISGIPWTQALVTIYLATTLIRLLRTVSMPLPTKLVSSDLIPWYAIPST